MRDGKVISTLQGPTVGYLGEYILLSEDEIDGTLVLGASHRIANDDFDYVHLYKLLTNGDAT